MNFVYCFTKRVPSAVIFGLFFLTACSSATQLSATEASQATSEPVLAVVDSPPKADLEPTDSDVMYHVMAAEVLGAEGNFQGAAAEYLEAALSSDDPEIAERATRVAVSADDWQMVALASDRWAVLDPQSLDARQLATGSRLREGDYSGAEYQLAKILDLTEDNRTRGWGIVVSLLTPARDQARAKKVLNNLLLDFNAEDNADALFARSQMSARTGSLDLAGNYIERAIKLEPGRADLLAWSGRLAVNRQNHQLALMRYRQAWEVSDRDPSIAMSYAELLKRNKQPKAAQAILAELPDTPEMRFTRIVFALELGDRGQAQLLYDGFSEAGYKDLSETSFQAAQSAELLGLKQEAVDWYAQVEGERTIRSIMRLAYLLAELGDIDEARNRLAQLRIQTDARIKSQSFQAEAQILQEADRLDEAILVLNQALESLPDDAGLRYIRALLAVNLGYLKLAESDLRQIIASQPDNAAALNALGYTLADLTDRYGEAEQLIFQAYELQPDESSIIDSMGWISYRLGRLKQAEMYLKKAWQADKGAEIAAHLGEVLWVSGRRNEAKAVWQAGTRIEADNDILIKTLQRFGLLP